MPTERTGGYEKFGNSGSAEYCFSERSNNTCKGKPPDDEGEEEISDKHLANHSKCSPPSDVATLTSLRLLSLLLASPEFPNFSHPPVDVRREQLTIYIAHKACLAGEFCAGRDKVSKEVIRMASATI